MLTKNIKRTLAFSFLLLALMACGPGQPTLAPTVPVVPATLQPTQISPTTPLPSATAIPAPPTSAVAAPVSGTVALQILSPQDGAVVNTPQIEVRGLAAPDTVVTINDDILIVDASGQFKDTVSLDEGPNLIEIIASDHSGNETSIDLTITYEP